MAKGYVMATEVITDPARFDAYGKAALPTIIQYGGKPLVVNDHAEVQEGVWHGTRTVVIEFDSLKAAHAWYNSVEYQAVVGERIAATESNLVILAGL